MADRAESRPEPSRKRASLPGLPSPARGSAARFQDALTFGSIVFFLALWITAFLLLKDDLLGTTYSGSLLTDLTCVTFFGGLVAAVLSGALVGNLLRRLLWKTLVRRGK